MRRDIPNLCPERGILCLSFESALSPGASHAGQALIPLLFGASVTEGGRGGLVTDRVDTSILHDYYVLHEPAQRDIPPIYIYPATLLRR